MILRNCLLVVFGLSYPFPCLCQEGEPYFRILAPQFLCTSAINNKEYSPPTSITIAFQTRGSQRLTYKVQVYFRLLDGFKNQRHTLSVWRSIRMLEKKIRDTKDEITTKNQIHILNEELIPGVEYTFNVIGIDGQGKESPAQNLTVTYRGSDSVGFGQKTGSSSAEVSFLLVGTWNIYRNIPFLVQGVIIFCDPDPFYKFKWTVTGLTKEIQQKYTNFTSKTLLIPAGLLKTGSTHEVSVEVENIKEEVIANAKGTLKILERDFHIQLVPNNQTVGINREIKYQVYVDSYEESLDKITNTWFCNSETGNSNDCKQIREKKDKFASKFSFSRAGLFRISVAVSLNGGTKNESAFVLIKPDIIPSVEILPFDPFEVVAGNAFTTKVRINYLIPECTALWTSMKSTKFSHLDTSNLAKGLGEMNLNDLEESFLSELIEFENDTTSHELELDIPKSMDGFRGLEGNGVYVFRLVITCPGLYDDEDEVNVTSKAPVISYSELILHTNDPPVVDALDVTPLKGEALKTIFKFSTAPAIDSPGDYPIRYRFYYQIDDFWVLVGDFYENTLTSAELPYLKKPIKTQYSACDSRHACLNIAGPEVEVTMEKKLSVSEMDMIIKSVNASFTRRDFQESSERLMSLIWTIYSWKDENQIQTIEKYTHEIISDQFPVVLEMFNSTDAYMKYLGQTMLKEWLFITNKVANMFLRDKIWVLLGYGE